jgi:hypothetical protein
MTCPKCGNEMKPTFPSPWQKCEPCCIFARYDKNNAIRIWTPHTRKAPVIVNPGILIVCGELPCNA